MAQVDIAEGPWKPIHDFCERVELPCLFPDTRFPVIAEENGYNLYLSKRIAVEAQVAAHQIAADSQDASSIRVIQVYRDRPEQRVLASTLRAAFRGDERAEFEDCVLADSQRLTPELWRRLFDTEPAAAVLWLGETDSTPLLESSLAGQLPHTPVFVSSSLLNERVDSLTVALRRPVFVTYLYELPGREVPHIYRVRAWLRSRGIESPHERILLNTYFAASVTKHALIHMIDNFSRDYLIESIEHETENALNPGVYPRLSLGPGQRFASRGCYLTRHAPDASSRPAAEPRWIIPE